MKPTPPPARDVLLLITSCNGQMAVIVKSHFVNGVCNLEAESSVLNTKEQETKKDKKMTSILSWNDWGSKRMQCALFPPQMLTVWDLNLRRTQIICFTAWT